MFDDIIMNMIRNKVLEYHVEGVDSNFTNMDNHRIYMYRGSLHEFNWKKFTHKIIDVVCPHFNVETIKTRQYFSNILKCGHSSDYMKEKIYHWLDYFEFFYKNYIIMPIESYYYSFPEEIRYFKVRSPPGFIHQENETRFHFNATVQILYCIVIFRTFIINVDWSTMIIFLHINNKQFASHFKNTITVKELQEVLVGYI